MSTNRRLIQIAYDVNALILRELEGGQEVRMERLPVIYVRENPLINLSLVLDSDLTKYGTLDATAKLEAAVDDSFATSQLICKTLASGINQAGDWWNGAAWVNPDITEGQISVRLNANTVNFVNRILTNAEVPNTKFEIQAKDTEDELVAVFRMPIRCLNLVNVEAAIPADEVDNFEWFTDPITGNQGLRIVNDDGEVLQTLLPPEA